MKRYTFVPVPLLRVVVCLSLLLFTPSFLFAVD